jgi:hypothetical protein
LLIIPEFRLDAANSANFYKKDDAVISPTAKSTASFILAAIVSF